MGGKARWRKLRRVVGVEPLGCHAPSRQRFKQDRAKTRDAKTSRDQARAEGVEGVEVDVLERMGVTALTESKKASKVKKQNGSLEIEFHDVAVNGAIIVQVKTDVDNEVMGVNGKDEHTQGEDDSTHTLEQHDHEDEVKDNETSSEAEVSKSVCDDLPNEHFPYQEDEFQNTYQNQNSNTKIVHFSAEPAKIIGEDDKEDNDSVTDRTVTLSPCSPDIEEDIREEIQIQIQDEIQSEEGIEENDDRGRLETIEECQKETYDEANQGQVQESQDSTGISDLQEKGHEEEAFMLYLNSTTVVIDGLGNVSEDAELLVPSAEEEERSEPEENEAQEVYVDSSSPKPPVLDEDENTIHSDQKNTSIDNDEQNTSFMAPTEITLDEYIHEESTELVDESEHLKTFEGCYNFEKLDATDKPDVFLKTADNEESVSICKEEVRFTAAPRRDSDFLDESSPDKCVSRTISMEVNTTESVKFFLSDSELSDSDYQPKNTDSDSNDRIQPEDWLDRMDEDVDENVDRQDETDDTTDIVIFDLDDTDDEVRTQMEEEDEQNRTLNEEDEIPKEVDVEEEFSTNGLDDRTWEMTSPDLESGLQYSTSYQHGLMEDAQTCTDPQHSPEDKYDPPEIVKCYTENNEKTKESNQLHKEEWEPSSHEYHLEKNRHRSEQGQRSTVAEKQNSDEDKQCFDLESETYVGIRHWEAKRQRRKLVQCCAILDEQVFAAYRQNPTPCALSSSVVGKYPILNKGMYESDQQSFLSNGQSSTENNNDSTLDTAESRKQEMISTMEVCSPTEAQPSSVTEEHDGGEDQQSSTVKRRDSIDNQQETLTGHDDLENQQFLTSVKRNSTDYYQTSKEEEQPSEERQQYTTIKEEQHLEKYQQISETRRGVVDDLQNSVAEERSEVYQQCRTARKRNSLESQQIYRIEEHHSEEQEAPPMKRRNSMENRRTSVTERRTSTEDQMFFEMSRQKSKEKRDLETEKQTWERNQQLPETKGQRTVEIEQSSTMERQDTTAYQESPRPMRQTSMEEQQTPQVESQDLQNYQQFSEMERKNSIEDLEKSAQDTKDSPENQKKHPTMGSPPTSFDREVLVTDEQISIEDEQHSQIMSDQYDELRTCFQGDRTSQDWALECDDQSEEKRQTPIDDLHYPQMNISNSVKESHPSEMNYQNPDNQGISNINADITEEEAQPIVIMDPNMAKHHQERVMETQEFAEEGLYPNVDVESFDDSIPSFATNSDDLLENPSSVMKRQDSSENIKSMNKQDPSGNPRSRDRKDSTENLISLDKKYSSGNPRSLNRPYSFDDDHSPVINMDVADNNQLDLMEGEVLRADEQYPVLQRQSTVDDQQQPLLQSQSSVESEQYAVVDGLKIRDSFDLYDQRISSPTIDSAYGDRLSLPKDLQDLTLSDESKAVFQSQNSSQEDHYKHISESTSPTPRVSKINMPFSIVDFDTNEDKNPSHEQKETSTPIHDQSDPIASGYHSTQFCQDNVMKFEVEEIHLDNENRIVDEFEETMIEDLTNRMECCQLDDTQRGDASNDENTSYLKTPPSFYPYSSPTPPQGVPNTSEDSDNLHYKSFDSGDNLNQYSISPSKDNVIIMDTEQKVHEHESLTKDEEIHKEKIFDEPSEEGKDNYIIENKSQDISPSDEICGVGSSYTVTTALYTKEYQPSDDQEQEHAKQDIVDSLVVNKIDPESICMKEELSDTTLPVEAAKPKEKYEENSVSQDIVNTERTISSISSPQNVEKPFSLLVSKIDDIKLLNKKRRQRRRTKSTTSSDGESQIVLDSTDGNFALKGEFPAKQSTSADSSRADGSTASDSKVMQDIKEFQGQMSSPVEAFTFAHNPEKSADLDQQTKKRFQRNTKKSKSRRKSDPRELVSFSSLDDDKDSTASVKGKPRSAKQTAHHTEGTPSPFPEPRESQKKEASGLLEKSSHTTAAGLCKETDKSIKHRQGSPMIKRKPRGYELKRSSSMKTYIREINEESVKSETLGSDLSRSLEISSDHNPTPRQYIPLTMSSSMPSQLPQPSVHAPRNIFTDNLQIRSSTPPNVGQDQMHTPTYPRSVLKPSIQSRKLATSTTHPPTLFLEQSKGLQGTAHTSQGDSTYLDSNRNRRSSPNANTHENVDHHFSSLNRSRMTTSDMGGAAVASSPVVAEAPQHLQQTSGTDERDASRATNEASGAKKMRRRRRR
ncbi:uncharacterized protein LOC143026331 [Oratosquilla oratoria]|uniref:uncharacterized protein LOC143026331 n=1 Tax=Oratosquilla oratoria TaxID=337810 RepID=UPI003F768D02